MHLFPRGRGPHHRRGRQPARALPHDRHQPNDPAKLLASPEDGTAEVAVKASWLAAICLRYHVSPAFLLLGSGPMFCGEGCPLNRRGQ